MLEKQKNETSKENKKETKIDILPLDKVETQGNFISGEEVEFNGYDN